MKFFRYKKTVLGVGVLAAIAIAALVFSFCAKQTEETVKTGKVETHQHGKIKKSLIKSPSVRILPSDYCMYVEIVCNIINGVCVTDVNYYIHPCGEPDNIVSSGTYHLENHGNGWDWAYNCCGPPSSLPTGVTADDMLWTFNDHAIFKAWLSANFPNCCANGNGGGTGPCEPVPYIIHLQEGVCITLEITCCDGEINGRFNMVDCNTGVHLGGGIFCAKYKGQPHNPTDPNSWTWCGGTAPINILNVLGNLALLPCI